MFRIFVGQVLKPLNKLYDNTFTLNINVEFEIKLMIKIIIN